MKNIFCLLFGTALLFVGCKESEVDPEITFESFRYYENSKITDQRIAVDFGSQTILHYYYSDSEELLAADAGRIENLLLEIPSLSNGELSFTITNIDIPFLNFKYGQSCFCAPIEFSTIKNVNLNGEVFKDKILINGSIDLELNFKSGQDGREFSQYTRTIEFKNTYFLESIPSI